MDVPQASLRRIIGAALFIAAAPFAAACDGDGSTSKKADEACLTACVDRHAEKILAVDACIKAKGLAADCGASKLEAKDPTEAATLCVAECTK